MSAKLGSTEASSSSALPERELQRTSICERKLIRRLDYRILPILGLLYALALIDRSNLGVARIAGMEKDLGLTIGDRFSIISCMYFVPYILLELPCNLLLRSVGVKTLLSFLVIAWGTTELVMGFVHDWRELAFCRVLLGAFEAGFFPALIFIISTWYTRHEVQKRVAGFYVFSLVTGGFSAIFAYSLSLLDGKAGLAGWRWIFVVEGFVTIVFGFVGWFYMPGFPDKNEFLSDEETCYVLERIEQDRGDSLPDSMSAQKILIHMMDWKVWIFGLMFLCTTVPAYANGFFIPIILRSMNWDVAKSLLLSAPPYIFSAVTVMLLSWASDQYRQRALFIGIQAIITLIGLAMTGYLDQPSLRYVGIMLSTAGSAGCIPGILAYASNNIISHSKRAVTTAMTISFGGVGGIIASLIFRQQDFPRYLPGIITCIASQVVLLVLAAAMTTYFWFQNRKALATSDWVIEGQPGFLYTL